MQKHSKHHVIFGQARFVSFEAVDRNRVHRHSYFEPCIVISGSGEFEHGSRVFALRAGDLFLADRGVYHEIRSLRSRDLELYFLAVDIVTRHASGPGSSAGLLGQEVLADFLVDHRNHLAGQSQLIPLFEHVTRLVRRDPDYQSSANYQDACLLLLRQILTALTDSSVLSEAAYDERLQRSRVEEAIEDRLHQSVRIAELASACGMSERTLRRRWKLWSRRSLSEEINHRRVERACQLLQLPDISVADVAYQVGIASPAQFSRLFRKSRGYTPREYRQRFIEALPQALSGTDPERTEYLE